MKATRCSTLSNDNEQIFAISYFYVKWKKTVRTYKQKLNEIHYAKQLDCNKIGGTKSYKNINKHKKQT